MCEAREWKSRVDESFNDLCKVLNADRFLDHEIRAAELLLTEMQTRETPDEARPYTIYRKQTSSLCWNGKRGSALLYKHGALIWYLKDGTRLQKMIVVGHELGHIYLHHINLNGVKNSDNLTKNRYLETQATYLSKKIIERRSALFQDTEYINERQVDNWQIDEEILSFQPDYNELMPDK